MADDAGKVPIKTMQVRASICVLTFNGEKFLREQLESVLKQMMAEDEMIIVDNCSLDSTRDIIEDFVSADARLQKVLLNRNMGVTRGFEFCSLLAKGEFIFFCDQDDVWLPTRLEKQIAALSTADLSVCNAALVNSELVPLGVNTFNIKRPKLGWNNLLRNAFSGCCMAIRRNALEKMLPFPTSIPMHDWYIAQAAYGLNLKSVRIEEELLLFRRHGSNSTFLGGKSPQNFIKQVLDRLKLLKYSFKGH